MIAGLFVIDGNVHIKTAFDASPEDIAFYEKHGK